MSFCPFLVRVDYGPSLAVFLIIELLPFVIVWNKNGRKLLTYRTSREFSKNRHHIHDCEHLNVSENQFILLAKLTYTSSVYFSIYDGYKMT